MKSSLETCARKKFYYSYKVAFNVLQKVMRRNPKEHFNVYKCDVCGYWHIGHIPEKYQTMYTPTSQLFLSYMKNVTPIKRYHTGKEDFIFD